MLLRLHSMPKRKAAPMRKDDSIRIRVTGQQKKLLGKAAQETGLDLSSWLRSVALEAAKRRGNA